MNRSIVADLAVKLGRIYMGGGHNKEYEYKRAVFYTLKDLGGVYIKFLQALSVMDGWSGPKEFEVFNRVKVEPIDVGRLVPHPERFASIETEPFATGSFAQVYRGQLKSGATVAVKVLRPSVYATLPHDLAKLKRLGRLVSRFTPAGVLDYNKALAEFSRSSLMETDYNREIANMNYFYNLYDNHPHVIIPKVYEDLCSRVVITQEYINGPTLADVMAKATPQQSVSTQVKDLTGSDVWTQIVVAGGEALRTAMTCDYVYGDPHPGNIILLPHNRIAFIDFGIIAQKPTSQRAYYDWVRAYHDVLLGRADYGKMLETTYTCFCPDLANALQNCSLSGSVLKSIADAVASKAQQVYNDGSRQVQDMAADGHLMTLFTRFIDKNNSLNVRLDVRNFQLLKAMQAFIGTVTTLDNIETRSNYSRAMTGTIEYALEYCKHTGIKDDLPTQSKYSLSESYELLAETLSSLAGGDEFIFRQVSGRMRA